MSLTLSDIINLAVIAAVIIGFVLTVRHTRAVNSAVRNGHKMHNDFDVQMLQSMNAHIKNLERLAAEKDEQIAAYQKAISRQLEHGGAFAHIPSDISGLRTKLLVHFSEEEVKDLCQALQLPYEGVAGGDVREKIINIIDYLNRYNEIGALTQWLKRHYPDVDW